MAVPPRIKFLPSPPLPINRLTKRRDLVNHYPPWQGIEETHLAQTITAAETSGARWSCHGWKSDSTPIHWSSSYTLSPFVPSYTLWSPPLNRQHIGLWGILQIQTSRQDPCPPKADPQGLPTFQVSIFIKGLSVSVMSPGLIKKGCPGFREIAQPAKPPLLKHENLSLNSRTHLKICVWPGRGGTRL